MTRDSSEKSSTGGGGRHLLFEFGSPSNGESPSPPKINLRDRLHRSLRAAIRSDQMVIDRMISRLDFARREDYGLMLNVHYSTLRDLSTGWRDEDREEFLGMAHCLQEDLHSLGFSPLALPSSTHAGMTAAARLGIAYIIRGSRYDSMALRHRVPLQYGASYLDFSTLLSWSRFLEQLERHVSQASERDETLEMISRAKSALARITSFLAKALA
jgi:heme oxygenase